MKYLIGLIFLLMGVGAYLAYSSINNGDSSVSQMKEQIKKLEKSLQDEQARSSNQSAAYAKNDEVNNLKAKISELENKLAQNQNNNLDELKKQMSDMDARLKKKEELSACDQCAIDNCVLAQKKKLEQKPVVKQVVKKPAPTPYKKPECPNKDKVLACVTEKETLWKAQCKITTTPEKVKSSFISSEKQVTKNLHKEKETLIVSLEPGQTKVPDLSICLQAKETFAKDCQLKYCAGY